MTDRRKATRRILGKIVAIVLTAVLLLFSGFFFLGASGGVVNFLAAILLIWIGVSTLIVSGPNGREESQRIIERPFDERERAIRSQAFATSLVAVVLLSLGWVLAGIAGEVDALGSALTIAVSIFSLVIAAATRGAGASDTVGVLGRPADEREQAIRTGALAVSLVTVGLFNLVWAIAAIVAGGDAFVPILTVLFAGTMLIVSTEVLRRQAAGPSPVDVEPMLRGEAADYRVHPTWIATIIAWVLAMLATIVVGGFFGFIPEYFGIPRFIGAVNGFPKYLGAEGLGADVVLALFLLASGVLTNAVFSLVASRWLNRTVSLAWLMAFSALSYGLARLLLTGSESFAPFVLIVAGELLVLRYLAIGAGEPRGIAARMRLSKPALAVVASMTFLAFAVSFAFATVHPLSLELATTTWASKSGEGRNAEEPYRTDDFGSPVRVDLQRNASIALAFRSDNRGPADLTSLRITAIATSPAGGASIESLRPARSTFAYEPATSGGLLAVKLPAHTEKAMHMRMAFTCTGGPRKEIILHGFRFKYKALGREWNTTVPMDDLIVTCPKRVPPRA